MICSPKDFKLTSSPRATPCSTSIVEHLLITGNAYRGFGGRPELQKTVTSAIASGNI